MAEMADLNEALAAYEAANPPAVEACNKGCKAVKAYPVEEGESAYVAVVITNAPMTGAELLALSQVMKDSQPKITEIKLATKLDVTSAVEDWQTVLYVTTRQLYVRP